MKSPQCDVVQVDNMIYNTHLCDVAQLDTVFNSANIVGETIIQVEHFYAKPPSSAQM